MVSKLNQSDRAVLSLLTAGNGSFITCESGPVGRARVVVRFPSVEHAQAFHRALIKCGDAARRLIQDEVREQEKVSMATPIVYRVQPTNDGEQQYEKG
jgi:hypothetical protein